MIDPIEFIKKCRKLGIEFFAGVPDSAMKSLCNGFCNELEESSHVIAANEGSAIALAAGAHLATDTVPLIYLQNSGQGNTLNPLISMSSKEVFSIPMILLVGWRGKPGLMDEPQHILQGGVTTKIFDAIDIPIFELSPESKFDEVLEMSHEMAKQYSHPVCILVTPGLFSEHKLNKEERERNLPLREQAIECIVAGMDEAVFISTTGKGSRELFEIRERRDQSHSQDFLVVGSMGHCSQISLGVAMNKPDSEVVCIDGDGAGLMHMGSFATIGEISPSNLTHVLINNGVHESVGGHFTTSRNLNFSEIARVCGYNLSTRVSTISDLEETMERWKEEQGPKMIEVITRPGSRDDLSRPNISPIDGKRSFMEKFRDG